MNELFVLLGLFVMMFGLAIFVRVLLRTETNYPDTLLSLYCFSWVKKVRMMEASLKNFNNHIIEYSEAMKRFGISLQKEEK